ncbi:MAG: S1C family serine protease [Candidatus Heritagella sp.]
MSDYDYEKNQNTGTPQNTSSQPGTGAYTHPYGNSYQWQGNPNPTGNGQPAGGYSYTPSGYAQSSQSGYSPYGYGGGPAAPAPKPKKKKEPRAKKPMGKGGKIAVRVLGIILCCLLISGISAASVIGLINAGYIQVTGSSTDKAQAAFTITKVVEDGETASSTADDGVKALTDAEIAEKVVPSVVCVENYQRVSTGNGRMNGQTSEEISPQSEGSGVIATADGYIITNAHVVEGADSLKVVLHDGTIYDAKLVGSDSVTDLALLKVEASGLTAAQFGDSDSLKVGDSVAAVGNPGGLQFSSSCTYGHISALNREVTTSEYGYSMDCIQVDAAINPGNSGGALVNQYGQVIGITSSKIVSTSYEGIGFAIPVNTVQSVITDLMNYGYVKDRAMLGISGQYVDATTASFYGLTQGWYVATVTNPSAIQAGLQKGDVIIAFNGTEIDSAASLTNLLMKKEPGDTVTLTVYRYVEQDTLELEVTLIENTNQTSSQSEEETKEGN